MNLTILTYIATDLIVLAVLVGILYAPHHLRKDLMATYVDVNVGVLAVTLLLSTVSVAAGLGLGFFGVLSAIHPCSAELAQHKVVYFFVALALGLLGGAQTASIGIVTVLMGTTIAALWIGDHPALVYHNRHQVIILDHAATSETALVAHLERALGGQISSIKTQRLDLADNAVTVDVRPRVPRHAPAKFETATVFSDITSAVQPTAESTGAAAHEVQTTQPWSDTRLNAAQTDSRPESVEAQPLTMTPAIQYVTRSNSQMAPSVAAASR